MAMNMNLVLSISSNDRKYPHKMFSEQPNIFQISWDAVLHAKHKSPKRLGKGDKPMKSTFQYLDQEINMLYEKGILGAGNAKALLNTIWINNCILFGLRGTKEN
jgi:hypothetical protein